VQVTPLCRRNGVWTESGVELVRRPAEAGLEYLHLHCTDPDQVDRVALRFPADPSEQFFGFGEKFNSVNQRGKLVDLWVRNGASGDETYKPVPFWMSTRGYACALQTNRHAWVLVAHPLCPDAVVAAVEGTELSAVVFTGRSPKELLTAYTAWVGRPPCPEPWAFGPWKSRDWRVEDESTVRLDLKKQAELGIACTVKLIDAGWSTEPNNFSWDRKKYPDPAGLIQQLRSHGYEVVLWVCPWFVQGTEIHDQLAAKGFLLRRPDGSVYVHRIANAPDLVGSLLDFTHPGAVAWWQEQIRCLMKMGVRGIKTDFGEQVPPDAVFADGSTGATMHNAYPRLYNEVTWAVVSQYRGVLLARSAWQGSQRFPGIWAGDQSGDFAPWSGLPSVVRAGLSAGLSGFPYWGSDIGGYFNRPTADCFIRWAQFGAFSPIMEVHGLEDHDPWSFDEETLRIYRELTNLRCRLFPYIYTCAHIAAETGIPMMRALPLEFPHDPAVYSLDFAEFSYMFGDDLLVAPVCWNSTVRRRVYLPAGADWFDFWTHRRMPGGTVIQAEAPADRIPVFVKNGAILPFQRYPLPLGSQDREVWVYPAGSRTVTLYDGTVITCEPEGDGVRLQVENAPAGSRYSFRVRTPTGEWLTAELPDNVRDVTVWY